MKITTWTIALGVLLALVSCGSPANPTPTAANNTAAGPLVPTPANLAGTWNDTATVNRGSGGTDEYRRRITYGPAGAWRQESETISTPVSGPATYTYAETEGTFQVSDDAIITTSARHRVSSAPFTDTTTGWIDDTATHDQSQVRGFLYQGKLYANPKYPTYRALGTHIGMVGTWSAVQSSIQSSWYRYDYEFQDSGTVLFKPYWSSTSTFGDPSTTVTYQYSFPSSGTIKFSDGGNSITQPYLQVGDYLLTGTEAALGGAIRE